MPFRSEAEQIREQIRRSEEQAGDLLRERAELEQQLRLQSPRHAWVPGLVAVVIGASLLGGVAGTLNFWKRRSVFRENSARESAAYEARRAAWLTDCVAANRAAEAQLEMCARDLSRRAYQR